MACSLEILQEIHLKVVESSPDAKIVVDSDGVVIVFNQQAEYMFRCSRNKVLNQPIEMLLPEDIRMVHVPYRTQFFEDLRTREMGVGKQLLARRLDGETFPVQIKLAPIVVSDGVYALAVVRRVVKLALSASELRSIEGNL